MPRASHHPLLVARWSSPLPGPILFYTTVQLVPAATVIAVGARFLGMLAAGLGADRASGALAPEQLAALRALRACLRRGAGDATFVAGDFAPVAAASYGKRTAMTQEAKTAATQRVRAAASDEP